MLLKTGKRIPVPNGIRNWKCQKLICISITQMHILFKQISVKITQLREI